MSKIDLETKIEGLKKAIAEHKDFAGTYESELAKSEQELKDIDKPELTPSQMDDVYEAVECGVSEYDFSDTDNFDIEYGIEYDGRVHCENHELSDSTELVEMIVAEVSKLFAEKLDTTEPDHHNPIVEKITVNDSETEITTTSSEDEMENFNKKIKETKEKSIKKRTWF